MDTEIKKIKETVSYIRERYNGTPVAGIILGSGLGNFSDSIKVKLELPYSEIPNFPVSTVTGHKGKLIFGEVSGKPIIAMAGRFHYYEGYTASEVVFPVRVIRMLGVETLLVSNAAGGVAEGMKVGDCMIITDHISLNTVNPLVGRNSEELGPRFPDMSEPYDLRLVEKAKSIAQKLNISVREGVYFGVTGPTFETRAEYNMIRILGGDAVGMSTVQEIIAAVHAGMSVFAMSIITDIGIRDERNTITHEEVLQAAAEAEPKLTSIFTELIATL